MLHALYVVFTASTFLYQKLLILDWWYESYVTRLYIFNRAISGVQGSLRFYVGCSSHPCSVCWTRAMVSLLTVFNIRSMFL